MAKDDDTERLLGRRLIVPDRTPDRIRAAFGRNDDDGMEKLICSFLFFRISLTLFHDTRVTVMDDSNNKQQQQNTMAVRAAIRVAVFPCCVFCCINLRRATTHEIGSLEKGQTDPGLIESLESHNVIGWS